jgi:hypothetical protein
MEVSMPTDGFVSPLDKSIKEQYESLNIKIVGPQKVILPNEWYILRRMHPNCPIQIFNERKKEMARWTGSCVCCRAEKVPWIGTNRFIRLWDSSPCSAEWKCVRDLEQQVDDCDHQLEEDTKTVNELETIANRRHELLLRLAGCHTMKGYVPEEKYIVNVDANKKQADNNVDNKDKQLSLDSLDRIAWIPTKITELMKRGVKRPLDRIVQCLDKDRQSTMTLFLDHQVRAAETLLQKTTMDMKDEELTVAESKLETLSDFETIVKRAKLDHVHNMHRILLENLPLMTNQQNDRIQNELINAIQMEIDTMSETDKKAYYTRLSSAMENAIQMVVYETDNMKNISWVGPFTSGASFGRCIKVEYITGMRRVLKDLQFDTKESFHKYWSDKNVACTHLSAHDLENDCCNSLNEEGDLHCFLDEQLEMCKVMRLHLCTCAT